MTKTAAGEGGHGPSAPNSCAPSSCAPRSCPETTAVCPGVLVVHADGVLDCEELASCGAEPAVHEWELPCTDLLPTCGCTGDEPPFILELERAA